MNIVLPPKEDVVPVFKKYGLILHHAYLLKIDGNRFKTVVESAVQVLSEKANLIVGGKSFVFCNHMG